MPGYIVEVDTTDGRQRFPFTIDQNRPLGRQVDQVLEELRQRGVLLAGGSNTELAILCSDRELDSTRTPAELELHPDMGLRLQMRPRRHAKVRVPLQRSAELPITRFRPKGWLVGPLAGLTGGWLAWVAVSLPTDAYSFGLDQRSADLVGIVLLGVAIGLCASVVDAFRRDESVVIAGLTGVVLGGLGGALGGAVGYLADGLASGVWRSASFGHRLTAWPLAGAVIGAIIGAGRSPDPLRAMRDGGAAGAAGGAAGVMFLSLPFVPFELSLLLAYSGLAAAIGWSRCALPLSRARAVLELESIAGRGHHPAFVHEWALQTGYRVLLRDAVDRHPGAVVVCEHSGCWIHRVSASGAPRVTAGGIPVTEAMLLLNGDVIELGVKRYRFRKMPAR